MLYVAIAEDDAFDRKVLQDCLKEYGRDSGIEMEILLFSDGRELLEHYPDRLDLLFMDIRMEDMDGLTTARMLRRRDERVLLVFVTSMIQYAVQGYSVDAMDFLVKPVNYTGLKLCMDRAMKRLSPDGPVRLSFTNREGTFSVSASEISYFESLEHRVLVHTPEKVLQVDTSLAAVEKMVASLSFFRCHVSYLVNLRYVDRLSGNDLWVNGDLLSVSRYRRKEFLEAWSAWLG
ncbi:MAG: LytTR family DNA-binding domain-containing protein [Oscillospiraceae bacterium]|nr:LytTR family DNA-binding domain-containing protein [Oscillospiraceae bacterium]